MARTVEDTHDDVLRLHTLGSGDRLDILLHRTVEINDAVRKAGADRQLFHIDVRRIEQAAFFGNGQDG